jgi:hypothetical protein
MYEHIYHLSGGTHVKLLDRVIELRNGYIWLQNAHSTASVQVQTSNAVSEFDKGEFIVTYVPTASKTSLLVLNGEAKFFNSAEEELYQNVASSQFSFIDPEYENGSPRAPTAIGYESFHQIVSLFTVKTQTAGVEKFYAVSHAVKMENPEVNREFDSVVTSVVNKVELKKTIFIPKKDTTSRSIASVAPVISTDEAMTYYKKVQTKKKKISIAPVLVFGSRNISPVVKPKEPERKTAAYVPVKASSVVIKKPQLEDEFSKSFQKNYQQQPKHNSEVNRLIDELESYSSEYRKKY